MLVNLMMNVERHSIKLKCLHVCLCRKFFTKRTPFYILVYAVVMCKNVLKIPFLFVSRFFCLFHNSSVDKLLVVLELHVYMCPLIPFIIMIVLYK